MVHDGEQLPPAVEKLVWCEIVPVRMEDDLGKTNVWRSAQLLAASCTKRLNVRRSPSTCATSESARSKSRNLAAALDWRPSREAYYKTLMLLSLAKSVLYRIPPRSFRTLAGLTVLYMHGLVRKHEDERVQRLHLTVDEFRATISALKNWVSFVSIEEALRLHQMGETHKPVAVLTSDDGYVDNHDLLMPVAREMGVPLAVFVSTNHIDTGARFPTYLTRCFAYHAPAGSYPLPGLDAPLTIANEEVSRNAASSALSAAVYRNDQAGVRKLCAALVETMGPDRQADLDAKFHSDQPMTWTQVKAMHDAGVEIGAHAHDHAILHRGQPKAEVEHQVLTSKTMIEDRIGRCRYFAFPVGNVAHVGPQALEAVRDAGFDAAFSTINGTLRASRDEYLHPRVMLHRSSRADAFNFPFVGLRHDRVVAAKQAAIKQP